MGEVRLVLVAAQTSTWVIDGLVHRPSDSGHFGPPGTPVSIEIERPQTLWFDLAMDELLRQWTDEGRVVSVELAAAGPLINVRLDCSNSTFRAHLVRIG